MTVVPADALRFHPLPGRSSADPLEGHGSASSARVVHVQPGLARPPHRHPHSEEVAYVVEGTGWIWIEGSLRRVGAGDCVYLPAGVSHATLAESAMRLVCFFPHPDLRSNLEEMEELIEAPEEA